MVRNHVQKFSIILNALKHVKLTTRYVEKIALAAISSREGISLNIAKLRCKKSNELQRSKLKCLGGL